MPTLCASRKGSRRAGSFPSFGRDKRGERAARLGVSLQTLAIAGEAYTAAVAKGRGDWASGAIATVLEEIVGLRLADIAAAQDAASGGHAD